jgi:predicted DNA-binding transcriptional regulator YafY
MRADRLLSILLLLQVHRRLTARELAKRLEVSERTILRDMDALSSSGVPVTAERGPAGGWGLLDDYQTKLTGLSATEIQALFLSRPARLMADLGLQQPSEAALIKLQASLPAAAREQAEFARRRILIDASGWRDPAESIACLPVLLDALWQAMQECARSGCDCPSGSGSW